MWFKKLFEKEVKVVYVDKECKMPKVFYYAVYLDVGLSLFMCLFIVLVTTSNNRIHSQVLPRVFSELDEIQRKLNEHQQNELSD